MPPATGKIAASPLFYDWYTVLMAFTANFMSVDTGFYLMNAFMEPLCDARHWTRTDISLAPAYATAFSREAFPSMVRFTSLFLVVQMVGFSLAGQSFDRTGS